MGTYDISRVIFNPRKQYSSVRMQQGRVITDDDWNENERIENEERRRSRVDIIGPHGSPDRGFRIENLSRALGRIDFDIHLGTYHLGGLRFEVDTPGERFRKQHNWLRQATTHAQVPRMADGIERFDMVYLKGWQQAVSAVEDDELLEKALAGPDTSTRIKNRWQVKLFEDVGHDNCPAAWKHILEKWEGNNLGVLNREHELLTDARLRVSFTTNGASNDLCSPSIAGGYLGAENQAIRVQLINDSEFTWGYDNASSIYRVKAKSPDTLVFDTYPRDQHHWPLANQVVEILPCSAILPNGERVAAVSGYLTKVSTSFNPDSGELVINTPLPANFGEDQQSQSDHNDLTASSEPHYYLRVWNRGTDLASPPAIAITGGAQPLGSTGIEVTITGNMKRANDYWVIAARPETPDELQPWSLQDGIAPNGIRRFFAPLALIRWVGQGENTDAIGEIILDCRKTFRPLTDLEGCCTFTVGDGENSRGDYDSIEAAVAHLPLAGGKICVLPGIHEANVKLLRRKQVRISGCGARSVVRPREKKATKPIFSIVESQHIQIDNLTLAAPSGTAIRVMDGVVLPGIDHQAEPSQDIMINDNQIIAFHHGITITLEADRGGENNITILRNQIGMMDKTGGGTAIFSLADGVLIERNTIFVKTPPASDDDPNDGGGVIERPEDTPFDPCADPKVFYVPNFPVYVFINKFFLEIAQLLFFVPVAYQYKTEGGIQIGGSSERVRILENKIVGGKGNGITLGHLPSAPDDGAIPAADIQALYGASGYVKGIANADLKAYLDNNFLSVLYEISVERNQIQQMGLSGIGVQSFFSLKQVELMISIEDLTIYRNHIRLCARQMDADLPEEMLDEMAFGGVCLADVNEAIIQENRIEDNGLSHIDPICGVFILNGEKVDVSNNQILNNGPYFGNINQQRKAGRRGGIVIANSFKQFAELFEGNVLEDGFKPVLFDNTFALRVHDNIIIQPLGQALRLFAFGPVSVVGNQLSSQGIFQEDILNLLAGTVLILNLGISKDLIAFDIAPKFKEVAYKTVDDPKLNQQASTLINSLFEALQYLPSGRTLFTNNQVTLDLRNRESTIAISSQLIISLDDVAYNSNQAEVSAFFSRAAQSADIVIFDAILVGYSVRSNDNRFQEGYSLTLYSLFSLGYMNTALGNHSTYCLLLYGTLTPDNYLFNQSNKVRRANRCDESYDQIGASQGIPKMKQAAPAAVPAPPTS
ncbi:MAG: DUF6519 domain-containing protein [Bacteroidota bacterium]